jgi:manganese peroxidase
VWDVQFYAETMNANSPQRIFKFQSDVLLSQDSRTRPTWLGFTGQLTGQVPWNIVSGPLILSLVRKLEN